MLLGKRPRHPIKRTTSLSEITFDLDSGDATAAAPPSSAAGFHGQFDNRFVSATVSPRTTHRRASTDFSETAHFLRACSLCRGRLVPGRDIYMYRGDGAFCSQECREQQMAQDERKEKCSLSAKKEESAAAAAEGRRSPPCRSEPPPENTTPAANA